MCDARVGSARVSGCGLAGGSQPPSSAVGQPPTAAGCLVTNRQPMERQRSSANEQRRSPAVTRVPPAVQLSSRRSASMTTGGGGGGGPWRCRGGGARAPFRGCCHCMSMGNVGGRPSSVIPPPGDALEGGEVPPHVTFHLVSLRGPGQSPVLPSACCVGSRGRCSCWCRFRVRGAQWLVCWGCA